MNGQKGSSDSGLLIKLGLFCLLGAGVVVVQGWIKHLRMKRDGYVLVTPSKNTKRDPLEKYGYTVMSPQNR